MPLGYQDHQSGKAIRGVTDKREDPRPRKGDRHAEIERLAYFRYLFRKEHKIPGSAHEDYCRAATEYDAR